MDGDHFASLVDAAFETGLYVAMTINNEIIFVNDDCFTMLPMFYNPAQATERFDLNENERKFVQIEDHEDALSALVYAKQQNVTHVLLDNLRVELDILLHYLETGEVRPFYKSKVAQA